MTDHRHLLEEFVRTGSETAFRELVSRYLNFVYSTALRLMDGNSHLAEEVAQTVFIHLARNARKLKGESMLGGWLHRDACFVAGKIRRTEHRRQMREREAAQMNSQEDHSDSNLETLAPILDEAINQLGEEDRHAILLRFYEQQNFRSVAAALGSNEDAARMRVTRALDKLHVILERRGVTLSAAALATILTSATASAAPAHLIGTFTGVAVAGATAAAGTTTFLEAITMAKFKTAIVAPLVVAGVTGVLLVKTHRELRNREAELRARDEWITQLEASRPLPLPEPAPATDTTRELLQLRGEVGVLRKQLADAEAARLAAMKTEPALDPAQQRRMETILRQQYLTRLKMSHARNWMLGFIMHAAEHEGRLPTDFSQAAIYLNANASREGTDADKTDTLMMATNGFQIVYKGSVNQLTNNHVIVLASNPEMVIPGDPSGGWTKVYGFADGSVHRVDREDGNFDDWEKEFSPPLDPAERSGQ